MSQRKPVDGKAAVLMTGLCAIWGMQQIGLKAAAPDMAPVLQVSLRSGLTAPVIFLLVLLRGDAGALGHGTWKPGILAGLFFGSEFLCVGEGLRFTSASHMAIFLYMAPIFAALGLHLRLPEERLSLTQWGGIGLAFLGVAVSFAGRAPGGGTPAGGAIWLGDLLGIAAAMSWSGATLTIRFSRLSDAPATVTLLYQLTGGFLLLFAAALATGQTGFTVTPILVASLAFQTVMVSCVSFLAWFALLRTYLASQLGVLSFMTPLFGVAFGVVLLDEALDAAFVVGAAMVLAGVFSVSRGGLRRRRFVPRPGGRQDP